MFHFMWCVKSPSTGAYYELYIFLDTQVSLAPTPVSLSVRPSSVRHTFGFPFWQHRDDIVVATGVDKLAVEVADMVMDTEMDIRYPVFFTPSLNIILGFKLNKEPDVCNISFRAWKRLLGRKVVRCKWI